MHNFFLHLFNTLPCQLALVEVSSIRNS
jgi:hypothetical protein